MKEKVGTAGVFNASGN